MSSEWTITLPASHFQRRIIKNKIITLLCISIANNKLVILFHIGIKYIFLADEMPRTHA